MKRRGVYEAGLPASSWRIATSTLIPLAFQLRCCNLGEDSYRTQGIRAGPEQFDAVEQFAARCGVGHSRFLSRRLMKRGAIVTVPARHLENCVLCCYFHF